MKTIHKQRKIDHILSEADELLNQLNAGLIENMEETQRTQLEIHANELKKLRREIQAKSDKGKISDYGSFGAGFHKAIEDIVSAMKVLKNHLT